MSPAIDNQYRLPAADARHQQARPWAQLHDGFVFEIKVLMTKHKFLSLREQRVIVSSDSAPNHAGWDWKERPWSVSALIKATCEYNFRCKSWPRGSSGIFPFPNGKVLNLTLKTPDIPPEPRLGAGSTRVRSGWRVLVPLCSFKLWKRQENLQLESGVTEL